MKAYLYCTKAKPYLQPNLAIGTISTKYNFNGTVCFECEIEKAEKVLISPFPLANGDYQYGTKTLTPDALETWSCLSVGELNDYNPRYVLYLYNVKAIKPKPITDFFGYNGKDLRYGYQNMGRIVDRETNICHLCISIKPEYLCKILNGEKTIDVRRVITKELKELING